VTTPVDYASPIACRKHSFFSVLSVGMSLVTVGWLGYVQFARPRYHQGGPFWVALWEWSLVPGAITLLLAIIGILQGRRKRWLSFVAMAIVFLAYLLLPPPSNFA
jgi:hypothetical protein